MIYGNLNYLQSKASYPTYIWDVLELLKSKDWSNLENGKYSIKGDSIFMIISSYETSPESDKEPEVHKKYIDVQYILEGVEVIKVANDMGDCLVSKAYIEENDIMFYESAQDESSLVMKKGDFAVFYPHDIHKPGCHYKEKSKIRKVVVKISADI